LENGRIEMKREGVTVRSVYPSVERLFVGVLLASAVASTPLWAGYEELAYDDGTQEQVWTWTTSGGGFAVRFTPTSSAARLLTARFYFGRIGNESSTVLIHLLDARRQDMITPIPYVLKRSQIRQWIDIDLSGYDLVVTDDFYLAELQAVANDPFIGADHSSPAGGRSWGVYGNGVWSERPRNHMIRAVVEPLNLRDIGRVTPALIVTASEGGSVLTPGEGRFPCDPGTVVPLEAAARGRSYRFDRWTGSAVVQGKVADPQSAATTVLVDGLCSVRANFKQVHDPWTTVYAEDFEGPVGEEWSSRNVDITPIGQRRFLGQFGNGSVTLFLQNLPPHAGAKVSFDLFIIRSWDGNGLPDLTGGVWGPDIWSAAVQPGSPLLSTTFDNEHMPVRRDYHRQSYPAEYPRGSHAPQMGATETNTLGFLHPRQDLVGFTIADSVYRLQFAIAHAGTSLTLDCSAVGLQALADESWGLDNVQVELSGEAPIALVPLIAHDPSPADQATEVAVPAGLQWKAGRTAVFHDVYFSWNRTLNTRTYVGRQTETHWLPPFALAPGQVYYWRVDEVEADGATIHVGDPWSFSTGRLAD
jgi:hypothetical protein